MTTSVPPPPRPPSASRRKAITWLSAATAGLCAIGLFLSHYFADPIKQPDHYQHFVDHYEPSIQVWSRDDCRTRVFANTIIDDNDNVNMRKQQEAWFCSHQWDPKFIASAAAKMEKANLLPKTWHPGHELDELFYRSVPNEAALFSKVFDGRLILADNLDYDQSHSAYPLLPSTESFKHLKSDIGLSQMATIQNPLPQVYLVNQTAPSIHLVTTLGTRLSLEETLTYIESSVDGRLFKEMLKVEEMGSEIPGDGMWMNPKVFPVAFALQLIQPGVPPALPGRQ